MKMGSTGFKLHCFSLAVLFLTTIFIFPGCGNMGAGGSTDSAYLESKEQDKILDFNETQEKLIEGIGIERYEEMVRAIGEEELDLLSYGAGVSNLIALVNAISDMNKLIALMGTGADGLGPLRTLAMLDTIDSFLQQNRYTGILPPDQDTIGKVAAFVNGIGSVADVTDKVVAMIDGMGITRFMDDPQDQTKLDSVCKLMAHVNDVNDVVNVLNGLDAATVTTKMVAVLNGVNDTEDLAETMDHTDSMTKMVATINGVTDANDLITTLNTMGTAGGSKMGYVMTNAVDINALIYMINNIDDAAKMGQLIGYMEDSSTWTGQVTGSQTWDVSNWSSNGNAQPSGVDSGVVRLTNIINGLATAPGPAKLVTVMNNITDKDSLNGFDEMKKMMMIIQDMTACGNVAASEENDMVALMSGLADPGANAIPCTNMGQVMDNVSIANITKMRQLVDGQRIFLNSGSQATYLTKLVELVTNLSPASEGPLKVADLVDGVSDMDKIIDLTYDVSVLANLSNIINNINKSSSAAPNHTAVRTMVVMLEGIADIQKMVYIIDNISTPSNLSDLINGVAAGSQVDDLGAAHLDAAGEKLNNVIDGISTTPVDYMADMVFIMDNVGDFGKMSQLINALKIASCAKMSTLVNNISNGEANEYTYTPGVPYDAAKSHGKLCNMIDHATDLNDMAILLDNITEAQKLSDFINLMSNSSLVVQLLNEVNSEPTSTAMDMAGLMENVALADISKLAAMVEAMLPAKYNLVAQLIAPVSGVTQGVGSGTMATLISNLNDDTAAQNTATLLNGLNANLNYQGGTGNITAREGMVRFLNPVYAEGVQYWYTPSSAYVDFPGVGPIHVAVMMNGATTPADLIFLMNFLQLDELVVTTGCGDHVKNPDFSPACTAVGRPAF